MRQRGKFGVQFGEEESMPVWLEDCGPESWIEKESPASCRP